MRKLAGALSILLCTALFVPQTQAQQSQPSSPPKNPLLTNAEIVKMVKAGLQDSTILSVIATSDSDFDVSVDGLLALKDAGVSSPVMDAMLAAKSKKRTPAPAVTVVPNVPASLSAMPQSSMTPGYGSAPMTPQMAAMMSQMGGAGGIGGMSGMGGIMYVPPALPKINLLLGSDQKPMTSSMAQMAQSATKGGPSAGSAAGSTLRSFVTEGLSFAAIAGGGMFAGPAMGIASGMMGGMMGGHHGMPTTTYVWALPGHTASYVMPTPRPKFDLEFGNIAGLDPDRYEPVLVHLPQTKDNYRLVGATKQKMSYMGPGQAQSMIDEERTPLQSTRLGRGHMQLEPAAPLAPGEYGLVLRPTKADKPKKGMSQSGAEQGVFYSVWDFSVAGQTAAAVPPKK
ncbi:MAG: hypothetical protein WB755_05075 [Terriglobales bacterium]